MKKDSLDHPIQAENQRIIQNIYNHVELVPEVFMVMDLVNSHSDMPGPLPQKGTGFEAYIKKQLRSLREINNWKFYIPSIPDGRFDGWGG